MDDPDSENESLEASVEELENKVERLENETQGRNQVQMQAYDIRINASSEDTEMEELMELCSTEMDSMLTQALVGEYQELEQEEMFSFLLGDD
jgi:hypothetical protein